MIGSGSPWSVDSISGHSDRLARKEWPKLGEKGTPGGSLTEGRARRPLRYSENETGSERRRSRRQRGGKKDERVRHMKLRSDRDENDDFDG